jgi:hypothetical protein
MTLNSTFMSFGYIAMPFAEVSFTHQSNQFAMSAGLIERNYFKRLLHWKQNNCFKSREKKEKLTA